MSSHRISRWLMQQCHSPQCPRASRNLPGLSLHPKPPDPWELGAGPVFHPFCSNPSPHPSQGWKSPSGWQVGITARYKHTQPGCPKASGGIPPRDLLPWVSQTTTCSHSLDWGAAPSVSWRGTRQLLCHCSLHTHPGASQSSPSPGPTEDKGRTQRGGGVLPPCHDLLHPQGC